MPKSSTKSRSKRVQLKTKYKILKKVKEHKRKQNKELKAKLKTKKKPPKMLTAPAVPAGWPFKEQVMAEYEHLKAKEVADEAAKKAERKARKAANRDATNDMNARTVESIQAEARQRAAAFALKERNTLFTAKREASDPDGSRRAFYREFARVVESSDVILHVLDARDPLGCRCVDVERYIVKRNPDKKIVLMLNKIDLVPKEVAQAWLKYLREELPTVAFKCSTQKGSVSTRSGSSETFDGSSADCLGAETLLQLLKNYSRNQNLKTAITVGIVGFPNVGKSSIINSLMRTRAVGVGSTPGFTRQAQEVHLDKHVKLLDSPGIVFPTDGADGEGSTPAAAALRNAVKLEKLADPISPVTEIVKRCKAASLMTIYHIPRFKDAQGFLKEVAVAKGKLKKGGVVDLEKAARMVLQDWSSGKIPYFTMPPQRTGQEYASAAVVKAWGAAFSADDVFKHEASAVIAGLPNMDDSMFIETTTAGQVSMDMNGLDQQEDQQEGSSDMEADDEDEHPAPKLVASTSSKKGTVDLYAADGQYNPKAAKKAKKEAKKLSAMGLKPTPAGGADYDFASDFAPTDGQMVSGDEEEEGSEEEGSEEEGSEEEGSGDEMDD